MELVRYFGGGSRSTVSWVRTFVVVVPRIPDVRTYDECEQIARAAATAEGIALDPEVDDINEYPEHFSRSATRRAIASRGVSKRSAAESEGTTHLRVGSGVSAHRPC